MNLLGAKANPLHSCGGKNLLEWAAVNEAHCAERILKRFMVLSHASPHTHSLKLNQKASQAESEHLDNEERGVNKENDSDIQKHFVQEFERQVTPRGRGKSTSKMDWLRGLLQTVRFQQCVVFCSANQTAGRLKEHAASYLSDSVQIGELHTYDAPRERAHVLRELHDAVVGSRQFVLFAMDMPNLAEKLSDLEIPLIINYDFPTVPKYQYLTRANNAVCVINCIDKKTNEPALLRLATAFLALSLHDVPTNVNSLKVTRHRLPTEEIIGTAGDEADEDSEAGDKAGADEAVSAGGGSGGVANAKFNDG